MLRSSYSLLQTLALHPHICFFPSLATYNDRPPSLFLVYKEIMSTFLTIARWTPQILDQTLFLS